MDQLAEYGEYRRTYEDISFSKKRLYALTTEATPDGDKHEVHIYDLAGNFEEQMDVPSWTSFILPDEQDGLYLANRVIQPRPIRKFRPGQYELKIQYEHPNEAWAYHGKHNIRVNKARVSKDGGLWVLGESEDFAVMLKIRKGKLVQSTRFSSRLPATNVKDIAEVTKGTTVVFSDTSGNTLPLDFSKIHFRRESNISILQHKIDGDVLQQFAMCTSDFDKELVLKRALLQKANIDAVWSGRTVIRQLMRERQNGHRGNAFYKEIPKANIYLPPPERCIGKSQGSHLKFLAALDSAVSTTPPQITNQRIKLRMYVNDDANKTYSIEGFTGEGLSLSVNVDAADVVYEAMLAEVYPSLDQYQNLRISIFKDSGVLINPAKSKIKDIQQVIMINKGLRNAWEKLSHPQRRQFQDHVMRLHVEVGLDTKATWSGNNHPVDEIYNYHLKVIFPDQQKKLLEEEKQWWETEGYPGIAANHVMATAVSQNWSNLLTLAISSGADVNIESCSGYPLLILATKQGHTEMARTLLNNGISPNQLGPNLETALHLALEQRALGISRLLLDQLDLDINLEDARGRTVFDIANQNEHQLPAWVFEKLRDQQAQAGGPFKFVPKIVVPQGRRCLTTDQGQPTIEY